MEFIDVHAALVLHGNTIRREDGLHLNSNGARILRNMLPPIDSRQAS